MDKSQLYIAAIQQYEQIKILWSTELIVINFLRATSDVSSFKGAGKLLKERALWPNICPIAQLDFKPDKHRHTETEREEVRE